MCIPVPSVQELKTLVSVLAQCSCLSGLSLSFRAIIPRNYYVSLARIIAQKEGEPGNEASCLNLATSSTVGNHAVPQSVEH